MPTTANIKLVIHESREDDDGAYDRIIGYASNYGCDNPECTTAVINGLRWHAIPAESGVTLPSYHFRDADAAISALAGVA